MAFILFLDLEQGNSEYFCAKSIILYVRVLFKKTDIEKTRDIITKIWYKYLYCILKY